MADKMTNCVLAQCLREWGKTIGKKERMVSIVSMVRIPAETGESAPIKLHVVWMTLGSPGACCPPTWNSFLSLKELRIINILFTNFRIIIIYYSLGLKLLSLAPLS